MGRKTGFLEIDSLPLVSIITVVYNGELLIEQTIRSVIDQSFTDYEYIIIDGGSSDNTVQIINNYKSSINIFVSEKDNGIYDAMNKGALLAKGDYIIYLNSGDLIYPNTLNQLFINRGQVVDYDVLYGDIVNSSTRGLVKALPLKYLAQEMIFCHQAVLVKTNIQRAYTFNTKYKIAGDYDFFSRVYSDNGRFFYSSICFGEYDDTGISNTKFFATIKEYLKITWDNSNGFNKIRNIVQYLYRKKKFIAYLIVLKMIGDSRYRNIRSKIKS